MRRTYVCCNKRGGLDLLAVVLCFLLVLIVAAVLFPVLARSRGICQKSNCESNMKQIAGALKLYLQDWHDTYPLNRQRLRNGKFGRTSYYVKLTPAGTIDARSNRQQIGRYGQSWVELLYDYMEPPSPDSNGAWECRSASTDCYPEDSKTAYTTYVFNRNLAERPETCVRYSDQTLLVREMDRHVNSELRPTNYSCGLANVPPDSPFLSGTDSRLGKTETRLHGVGSHILFADSHVQIFPYTAYPKGRILPQRCWDATGKRWYNSLTGRYAKKIAVTP